VLASVNRVYDLHEAETQLKKLVAVKDDPFLAADVITGLPGESQEDFEATYEFLVRLGFSQIHVFPYSPRPDTPLFDASGHVPEYLRDERAQRLRELSTELYESYRSRWVSRQAEAIIEKSDRAVTGNYLKVKLIGMPEQTDAKLRGKMITGTLGDDNGVMTLSFHSFI
jgi:threonylcarbamoyladenosine tRNA methylthiotransferase MtaB